jgi:hypothetical protein
MGAQQRIGQPRAQLLDVEPAGALEEAQQRMIGDAETIRTASATFASDSPRLARARRFRRSPG